MNLLGSEFLDRWLLPEGMRQWRRRQVIRRRFRTRVTTNDRRILALNAALKCRHANERCFVIGNGPSLAQLDLTTLAGDISIGMNSIACHPDISTWSPTYYCRAEPGAAYNTPAKLESIRSLTEKLSCEGYFFPFDARTAIEQQDVLPRARTYYFKSIVDLTEWPVDTHPLDLTDGMPYVGNTAQFAILLAMYLGANPIILLGMDHDFLAHRSINRHFYAADARDVGGSDDLRIYPYRKMMADTLREWQRYEVILAMARQQGTTILNATRDSFLDVFPPVELDNVIGEGRSSSRCKARVLTQDAGFTVPEPAMKSPMASATASSFISAGNSTE